MTRLRSTSSQPTHYIQAAADANVENGASIIQSAGIARKRAHRRGDGARHHTAAGVGVHAAIDPVEELVRDGVRLLKPFGIVVQSEPVIPIWRRAKRLKPSPARSTLRRVGHGGRSQES